jgi:diguanylate cyclase (GGDEF)-like protein/PAS domain S-box-containing protein
MGLPVNALPTTMHELLGLIPEEDHVIFNSLLAGAQQQVLPFVSVEHRLKSPDGIRYLMVWAQGQFDHAGRPVRITGTMQDITGQKLADIQAVLSEQRWEAAFRNSPVPSIITEVDTGLCLDANEEMCRLLNRNLDEIVGKTTTELVTCPAQVPRPAFIDEVKQRGSVRQKEFRARINDAEHYFLINMERIAFNGHDALFGQWVDITPVKKLEEKLRLTAAVVEHAADALVLMNRKGHIVAINPAFTSITGYSTEQALDKWFVGLLHKPAGRHEKEFFRNAIDTLEQHNQWKGEVWTRRANGAIFPSFLTLGTIRAPETNEITHYVGVFSDISRQKAYEEQLRQLALHDELTGLANRTLLIERGNRALLQAERHDGMVAVLFVDLNRFKSVNDRFGHGVGDALLKQVADRLVLCVRASDTVARVGGDEFIILLTDLSHDDDAYQVADKVHLALVEPFHVEGTQIEVGASVGVARYPHDGVDIPMLLKFADEGLYQAKRSVGIGE